MGVPQHTKIDTKQLSKEMLKIIEQRSHLIWSSELSDINNCNASNIFVNIAVEYYFWTVKFSVKSIKEMDSIVRKVMNAQGAEHTLQLNAINYLPRNKGGRGLRSFEESYKITKVKLAVKLVNDKDPRMEIVREYHNTAAESNSFSIFKDAKRYAQEFDIEMNLEEGQITIGGEEDLPSKEVSAISNKLNKNMYLQKHNEILISTWQGLNLKQRIEDEDVNKTISSG